jgi:hypothetical protein
VPDFSTLSRRAQSLELPAQTRLTGGAIHLMVDSSGLKLGGPGEWLVEKHGKRHLLSTLRGGSSRARLLGWFPEPGLDQAA